MAAAEVVAEEDEAPRAVADLEEALSRRASSYDGRVTCWEHKRNVRLRDKMIRECCGCHLRMVHHHHQPAHSLHWKNFPPHF